MTTFGYARVSTGGQDLSLQFDALQKHGVAKELIFTDKASGAKHERPGLDACLRELREELGLEISLRRILCVEYLARESKQTESVQFVFDGGLLSEAQND